MRHREQFLANGGARISTGLQPSRSVSQYLRQQQVRQELTGRFFSKTGRERWQEGALAVLVSGQARLPVDAPTARGDGASSSCSSSSSSSVLAETHAEALERPHLTTWLAFHFHLRLHLHFNSTSLLSTPSRHLHVSFLDFTSLHLFHFT